MRELRSQEEIIKNWKGDFDKPIVTVLCTTYNHEKYIEDAIEGFLIQETDFPFEIIIHDDASTDKTAQIVREYEVKYPLLIKGIYQTKNRWSQGLKNAEVVYPMSKGEYIALCEGDDYWTDPQKLQIQKDFLDNNQDYVICYTGVEAFNENGIIYSYTGGVTKDLTEDELKKATPINTLTTMFRNIIKDKFPPEFNSSTYGDLFIWSILGYHGKGKYLLDLKASRYRVHAGGLHSSASLIEVYENTLITYVLLLSYHKKLGRPDIVQFYKKRIIHAIIMTNGFKFVLERLMKDLLLKLYNKFKKILKSIVGKKTNAK